MPKVISQQEAHSEGNKNPTMPGIVLDNENERNVSSLREV